MADDDDHKDTDSQGGDDSRRQMASLRMRKYRSLKKEEFRRIEDEFRALQHTLHQLKRQRAAGLSSKPAPPATTAAHRHRTVQQLAHRRTDQDRLEVDAQYKLACCLRDWVASQRPAPGLTPQSPWLHATLCADPDARRVALQWLSERGDSMEVILHPYDAADAPSNGAIEFHFHFDVVFVPFSDVVSTMFAMECQSALVLPDVVPCQAVESAADTLRYTYAANGRSGVTARRVTDLFQTPDGAKAVFTAVSVAEDELFPLQDGEVRSHGFGWTVAQCIAPSITRVTGSVLQYPPLTLDGPISLEAIGHVLGVDFDLIRHRDMFVERVQNAAEEAFASFLGQRTRALRQHNQADFVAVGRT